MSFLTWIITLPLTAAAVLLVVSNTGAVPFHVWPGEAPLSLPLYKIILPALLGGFFLGALFVFLHAQKTQFALWREKARAERLEKELEALHKKQQAENPPAPPVYRLPK